MLNRPFHRIRIAGRALCAAMVAAALVMTGCNALPKPLSKLTGSLSRNDRDESIRKQAKADPFPSAQQAGL